MVSKERDLRPGTPMAFRNGCTCPKGTVDVHVKGCVLWDGSSEAPNVGGIIVGSVQVLKVPVGCKWIHTTLGALMQGDIWTDDYSHSHFVGIGGWAHGPNGDGIASLFMRDNGPLNGGNWNPTIDVWKMEFVY